ncbi:membrane protease YdiL (CAAX protease family) [Duganella sp. 1224]|uniref:CPBP family intramembrane glutamic endopeptidase n=1 Tax=Duganella sp. 1224 TaxID=2587052 RepID=UPI0015CCECCD|nr:CPBP family intramembrane glutamic endopeptidase [Duganella sp. 1224]NYE59558.1 membrane protease YdiL (CAAX protease family) [Duganella sp. 1224]
MIDLALAFYLILIYPAVQLWRSVRQRDVASRPRAQGYVRTMRTISLALMALAAACWANGYSAHDLGLDMPRAGAALWCLLIPAIGLSAMYAAATKKTTPDKAAKLRALAESNDKMPRTPREFRLFLLTTLFVGAGWELLYRGFLTLVLTPYAGAWGAVAITGLAYGLAHGYRTPIQLGGSIVSALLFGAGYVLTGSLWWLIAIHIGLPLVGAIGSYHILHQQPSGEPHAIS